MSSEERPQDQGPASGRTFSAVRSSRWPGWIWAVPIAAAGVVAWLMVRGFSHSGIEVTVTFADAQGIQAQDTKVEYRGVKVGEVTEVNLSRDRKAVLVHLDIDDSVKADLTAGTRFYLRGATATVADLSSLKSIIAGPTIVMIPGEGGPARRFAGISGEPRPKLHAAFPYVVEFQSAAAGEIKPGSPVTLNGFDVGETRAAGLVIDTNRGVVLTSVVIDLDPTRFHIQGLKSLSTSSRAGFDAALGALVRHGLHARLAQSPPLIGPQQIELELARSGESKQSLERVADAPYPRIPAEDGGGIADLTRRIGELPIEQIGDNLRSITGHVRTLASAPELKDSIAHLERASAQLDAVMRDAGPQVSPTLESLHRTVDELDRAADQIDTTAIAARKVLGGGTAGPNGNVQQAVHELTGAARSIRVLANYLDQHPEALVKGR